MASVRDSFQPALERALGLEPEIQDDPPRLRAMLLDLCPWGTPGQIRALVAVAEEGVTSALKRSHRSAGVPVGNREIHRLARTLHLRAAIDFDHAVWAVEAWSAALGLDAEPQPPDPLVSPAPPGPAPSKVGLSAPPPSPLPLPSAGTTLPALPASGPSHMVKRGAAWRWSAAILCAGVLAVFAYLGLGRYSAANPPEVPAPGQAAAGIQAHVPPAGFWGRPGNLERLAGTFVGTLNTGERSKETLVLIVRDVWTASDQGLFSYTLNTAGTRSDNVGSLSPARGEVVIPELGPGQLRVDGEGRPVLVSAKEPGGERWILTLEP